MKAGKIPGIRPPITPFSAPDSRRQRGLLSLTVTADLRPLTFSAFGVVYTLHVHVRRKKLLVICWGSEGSGAA